MILALLFGFLLGAVFFFGWRLFKRLKQLTELERLAALMEEEKRNGKAR